MGKKITIVGDITGNGFNNDNGMEQNFNLYLHLLVKNFDGGDSQNGLVPKLIIFLLTEYQDCNCYKSSTDNGTNNIQKIHWMFNGSR